MVKHRFGISLALAENRHVLLEQCGEALVTHGKRELLSEHPGVLFKDLVELTSLKQLVFRILSEEHDLQAPQEVEPIGYKL